jgi:hypothetical protein
MLQSKLSNSLAGLLFVARVNGNGSTTGDGGLLTSFGLGVASSILDTGLGDFIVGEFFDSGVGHVDDLM